MADSARDTGAGRRSALGQVISRVPATLGFLGVAIAVGLITGALWHPVPQTPHWDQFAYGLPALREGRWWTPVTGTFLNLAPWVYITNTISLWGMFFLEYRRGWKVALAYFWGGQLFAVLGTSLLLWPLSATGWRWAVEQAHTLDVGWSGGAYACMAAAIGLARAPWRTRAWLVLLASVLVTLLFWGTIAELEHALGVGVVLLVDRSLNLRHATVREQRLVAFVGMVMLGIIGIITILVSTVGPFGESDAVSGGSLGVALDVVVITIVADGLRRARRWAWAVSLALAAFNSFTGATVLALIIGEGWDETNEVVTGAPSLTIARGALWLLMLCYLLLVRRAFRWRRRAALGALPVPERDEVKDLIRAHGGGTLSWMSTWGGNEYARTPTGVVIYQRHAGVALALADPLGPEEGRAQSVREFVDLAQDAGLIPCFFSADDNTRAALPDGWQSLVVADDTIVDLEGLQFTGKQWNSVRTSLNRAGREEMTFRMTHLADERWSVRQQLRAISEQWVEEKGLPEMGFTLGTLEEAEDPEVRIALAVSPEGNVDGFLSWLPVYGAGGRVRGWTLDLMRRREGGFGPVMEYLIGSSALLLRDEGADIMSLSGAPLAHNYPPDAGAIADLSRRLASALEPVYGFQSLHNFKSKFHPRYETMYLLFRDESDLARIGIGLTRAFLPAATLRQFAGAGIDLVRGGGRR